MIRTTKLDLILNGLLWIDKERLDNKVISKKITMKFLSNSMKIELKEWEMKSLEEELTNDGYIRKEDNQLFLTSEGKRFLSKDRGYEYQSTIQIQENIIREKTIEKFKYDKMSFWISILAIIISIIGFILGAL